MVSVEVNHNTDYPSVLQELLESFKKFSELQPIEAELQI